VSPDVSRLSVAVHSTFPSVVAWRHKEGEAVVNEVLEATARASVGCELSAMDAVDASSRAALLLTALAGRCEQWALVQATASVMQAPIDVGVLDPLVALDLAVVDAGSVSISRDSVQRAVMSCALPSQLQQAHLALAKVATTDALSRGWHLTHAATTPSPEAAELALVTARGMQSTGRSTSARVMFEQAARLSVSAGDRAARLVEAGAAAFALGVPKEAQHLLDVAEGVGTDPASALLSQVLRATFTTGEIPSSVDGVQLETVLARLHESALGPVAFCVLVATTGSWATAALGEIEPPAWLPVAGRRALAALRDGDVPSATRNLREFADDLAGTGLRGVETQVRTLLADGAVRTGDLSSSLAQARKARELASSTHQRAWYTRASVTEALVAALRGVSEAPELVEALDRMVLSEDVEARVLAELAHAVSLMGDDEWSDAFKVLVRIGGQVSQCPAALDLGLLGHLAEAALHTRREVEARELVSRVAESSVGCESGAGLVDLLYATALLAPEPDSDACFQVVQSLSAASWPWSRARSDLARGAVLRRRRRIVEARAHLVSAQRLFRAIGSPVWERRVQHELRAAGWCGSRHGAARGTRGWGQLSPQEQEIVRLAAEGLTNRQIGERLFLSPRTIGAHLYRSFPKLDVTSRTQLARLDLPC
jgi:DNA-binding CsgD family transcriptional regulator